MNKKWSILTRDYSNCSRKDNKFLQGYCDNVQDCTKDSNHPRLIEYFTRFGTIFPTLFKKEIFPCPTTCCWVNMYGSTEWNHIFNTSLYLTFRLPMIYCRIFQNKETQLASKFYGGLLYHLTSRPIWVSNDRKTVATVCTTDGVVCLLGVLQRKN